jgi:hypothetical protein
MNSPAEDLAFQKKLLVAQSSLHRLRIRNEVRTLREGLSWRRAGTAALGSPTVRSTLFLLAAEGLGTERVAHWLSLARRALAVARLAVATVAIVRRQSGRADADPR